MTPEQEIEEMKRRRLMAIAAAESIKDPLDHAQALEVPRMTPGVRLVPRAQTSQPLGLSSTNAQASPQYFLRSDDVLAPSRQGPVLFDSERYRQLHANMVPSVEEEAVVETPSVPDIQAPQAPASQPMRSFVDRENDALAMIDSAMPGLRRQEQEFAARSPGLQMPSLRLRGAEPAQAPSSNGRSYEEQTLAQLGPNVANSIQQVTNDEMQRARDMRRPWTLGPIGIMRQPRTPEQEILDRVARNAATSTAQFATDFTQRQQDMRRPWTLGPIGVSRQSAPTNGAPSLSIPQDPALAMIDSAMPGLHRQEQDVLSQFPQNAASSGTQTAGDFTRQRQYERRPWTLGPIGVSRPAPSYEQQVLSQFAQNAGEIGRNETAALQRRLQSIPEIGPIEFTPGQEQTLAQAETRPKEDTPFFELPKVVIKTHIPEPPKPPDTSSAARYDTPASAPPAQETPAPDVPRETPESAPETPTQTPEIPATSSAATSSAPTSPWEQELADARHRRNRMNIIRGILGGVGGLIGVIGAARGNALMGGIGAGLGGGALRGINPDRPVNDFLQDRQLQQDEQDRGYLAQDRATAADDRLFNQRLQEQESNANTAYRQAIAQSMQSSAQYRQHLAERDAALHDPNSPLAGAQRDVVRRLILSMPPSIQASYGGLDLRGLSSSQLKETADEILRRASMLYRRDRRIDMRSIRGAIYQLNLLQQAGLDPDSVDPAILQQILGGRIRGPGGGGRRAATAGDGESIRMGDAPAHILDSQGNPLPDRSLAQIEADMDAANRGARIPGREDPRQMSRAEMALAYRASQNRRDPAYEAANRILGHGTRSQEHEEYRSSMGTGFTERDFQEARRNLAEPLANIRRANNLLRSLEGISQAQFTAAVSRSGGVPTALGQRVENLTSQMAEHANRLLRSRAGQAVTDQEYRRVLEEMAAGRLNSIGAYRDALRRSIRNTQYDVQAHGYSTPFLRRYVRRVRGQQ